MGDAIQPSHPLSSPSPPDPNPSQHQTFSNESTVHMRWQLISDWSEWAINVSGLLNTKPVLYATPTAYPDISFLNRQ